MFDVTVVIVSYNASSYLKECIGSILALTKAPNIEIIVVDNNSTDNSVEIARGFGKSVTVVANKDNRGFGAGVNVGLKKATGKFVLVLNPDIRFLEDTISKMMAYLESHSEVGLAGCTLLDSEEKMLPNGGYLPTLTRLFLWTFFLDDIPILADHMQPYHPGVNRYKRDFYPDWVTGGFMFFRKEVADKAGSLDENIFMYGEEVEWQYRIKLAGWRIGYTTATKVVHFERGSQGGSPRGAILGEFKGIRFFYGKHFPEWEQILVGSFLDVAATIRVFFWLFRFKGQMAKFYLEALLL